MRGASVVGDEVVIAVSVCGDEVIITVSVVGDETVVVSSGVADSPVAGGESEAVSSVGELDVAISSVLTGEVAAVFSRKLSGGAVMTDVGAGADCSPLNFFP